MSTVNSSSRARNASRDAIRYSTGDRVIRVRRDSPTVTFEEVDDNPRAYQNGLPEGRPPGFGEEYEECDQKVPHFCGDCGQIPRDEDDNPIPIGQTCWRKECPRCAAGWDMRASYTITSKIEDYRKERAYERGGHSPKFHHLSLIPPYDEDDGSTFRTATDDPLGTGYEIAKIILADELGVDGGMLAYHSFSGEDGDDRGKWKERLFSGRDFEGDVADELHHRPHFHAVCVADHVDHQTCKAIYEQTGWVVHRIEDDDHVSLYDVHDLARATTYTLSHVAVGEDIDSYRYFGAVANHTASDQTAARMRRVVRSVVPETLGINPADLHCGREVDDDDPDEKHQLGGAGGGSGEGNGDQLDEHADDCEGGAERSPRCGGRLIPIPHAPGYLEDHDLRYETELREAYELWDGSPPPD